MRMMTDPLYGPNPIPILSPIPNPTLILISVPTLKEMMNGEVESLCSNSIFTSDHFCVLCSKCVLNA